MDLGFSVSRERGWSASLTLEFEGVAARTVLARRSHQGPLQVQRPFYPEGPGTAHVYVLHPPGGLVGGDELSVKVLARAGAHALLTTPAATKLYRSSGKLARSRTTLAVAEDAVVEWLPGETLAFNGARADLSTRVEIAPGGVFVGWEILGLGRPAAGERFMTGKLTQRFELWRADDPIWIERGRYDGDGAVLREHWGLAGAPVSGVLVAHPANASVLEAVRDALHSLKPALEPMPSSATLVNQLLIVRVLSPGAALARACLEAAWRALRPEVVRRSACTPRIWST